MNKGELVEKIEAETSAAMMLKYREVDIARVLPAGLDYISLDVHSLLPQKYGEGRLRLNVDSLNDLIDAAEKLPPEPLMRVKASGWATTLRPSLRFSESEQRDAEEAFEIVPFFLSVLYNPEGVKERVYEATLEWWTRFKANDLVSLVRVHVDIKKFKITARIRGYDQVRYSDDSSLYYWYFGTCNTMGDIITDLSPE